MKTYIITAMRPDGSMTKHYMSQYSLALRCRQLFYDLNYTCINLEEVVN